MGAAEGGEGGGCKEEVAERVIVHAGQTPAIQLMFRCWPQKPIRQISREGERRKREREREREGKREDEGGVGVHAGQTSAHFAASASLDSHNAGG
jgi:hypothetical protein